MRPILVAVAAATTALVAVPAAQAIVPCPTVVKATSVLSGKGQVESVAFDDSGRLLYTDRGRNALMHLDKPTGKPRVLAANITDPGGIAFDHKGYAYVGTGNNVGNALSPSKGGAGVIRVNLKTGKAKRVISGLAMANGVVRTAKGVFYASDDLAGSLDRVSAKGTVLRGWSTLVGTNGLALSANGRFLYANVSLPPTHTVKIDLRDPAKVTTVAAVGATEANSFLDGLTLGAKDRPYAAAFGAGQIVRGNGKGGYCAVASGLKQPSSVAFGRKGRGFDKGSLYAGTYGGDVVRLRGLR
jgi:sugar lactone lactonase YvrE